MESPRTPDGADEKRAAEAAEANQEKFGVTESYPLIPQPALAQQSVIIAGGAAGVRGRFGGFGAQLPNSAEVMAVALNTKHETAANQRRRNRTRNGSSWPETVATSTKLPRT